jgi:hypothetical protein
VEGSGGRQRPAHDPPRLESSLDCSLGRRINESPDDHEFYTRTNRTAHDLDPTRQTGGIRAFRSSELLEDVFTINDFGFPLQAPNHPLYLNTEFIGHTYSTKTIDNADHLIEHTLRHARVHDQLASDARYAGGISWCAFDYNTHANFGSGDRICYHGVMDIFREPKPAAGFYRSQCDPSEEVVLEPALHWADGDAAGTLSQIVVCSNCEHLKLFLGGKFLAAGGPDRKQFPHLAHPPFVFTELALDVLQNWGDLRIEGYIGGQQVIVRTGRARVSTSNSCSRRMIPNCWRTARIALASCCASPMSSATFAPLRPMRSRCGSRVRQSSLARIPASWSAASRPYGSVPWRTPERSGSRRLIPGWARGAHRSKSYRRLSREFGPHVALLESLMEAAATPQYGWAYTCQYDNPDYFAFDYAYNTRVKLIEQPKWQRQLLSNHERASNPDQPDRRRRAGGLILDVFPMNILSDLHLRQKIGDSSLKEWILLNTGSDSLTQISPGCFIWRVPAAQTAAVATQLEQLGLTLRDPAMAVSRSGPTAYRPASALELTLQRPALPGTISLALPTRRPGSR